MLSFKPSILEEKVNRFLFFGKARHKAHEWVREKLGYVGRVLAQDAISDGLWGFGDDTTGCVLRRRRRRQ